jgi:hypothetical protein
MDQVHTKITPDRRGWHVDKTLNVSHLFTTLVIAGSLFAYAGSMDKRVAILEEKMRAQVDVSDRVQQDIKDLTNDIKYELRLLRAELAQQKAGDK